MPRASINFARSDLQRLLHEIEQNLARLSRAASRAPNESVGTVDRIGDAIANALSDIATRFRGSARAVGGDVSQMGDDALQFGNDALRKLAREAEHRPLLMLAVAFGVGALAAGILARR